MQDTPIVDFSFTLSQLSGNKELAVKMLNRFKDEYADADKRIDAFLQTQDYVAAKQLVHTLKGVAGNLGIKALHLASKRLEESLRDKQEIDMQFAIFKQFLAETLTTVDKISSEGEQSGAHNASAQSAANHKALITLLKRNEFIPADKLNELIAKLDMPDEQKQQVHTAVDDLDYDQALTLLSED